VFTVAPNGTEATLYVIDPGETCVLALNCLFNDLLYPAWVQAETTTTVVLIRFGLSHVVRIRAGHPEPDASPRYRRWCTGSWRSWSRCISAITLSASRSSFSCARVGRVAPYDAAAVARHLGTTREVVARLLQGFVAHLCGPGAARSSS
jgi:CRP/FNR family transcriptional regulator